MTNIRRLSSLQWTVKVTGQVPEEITEIAYTPEQAVAQALHTVIGILHFEARPAEKKAKETE